MKRASWGALALALLAGLAQAMSLAAPGSGAPLWWLQLPALAVLVTLLDRSHSAVSAAALGLVFASAWMCGTFWWLFISMYTYGGLAAPLAALAVLALGAFVALFYAAACAAWRAWARGHWLWRALVFAALWLLAELCRGQWLTGFPWGAAGYSHVDGPLAALAPLAGVYGMSFMAALLAALLAFALRRPVNWGAGVAVALLLAALVWTPWAPAPGWSRSTGTLDVALLQGNIPQDEKFQPGSGVPVALQWYGERLQSSRASLVIAPETALPMLPQQLPAGYLDAVRKPFTEGSRAALVGIPLGSFADGYTNSVQGWVPGVVQPYRYDKHHLVPFGEFIPPLFRWFTDLMRIPLGDFNRGTIGQPSLLWQGQRIAPNICYEDLFGEELGARFRHPEEAPTILANFSNIGWFGNSVAIDQHLHISRLRALEFSRPMVRATNTGATAIIDHEGRVTHQLERHTRGVLEGQVEGREGTTPYAWWVSRAGLWPLWGLGLLLAALAWRHARRRQHSM